MRSIEDLAAEEDARIRKEFQRRLGRFLLLAAFGLGIWGWILFSRGVMGRGAFVITVSLMLFALGWGAGKVLRVPFLDFFLALLASLPPFVLYHLTRLPSFYWGNDPAFWLAIHGGAVPEPLWSPLSYLLGQAVCFVFPGAQWTLLTELSATGMAVALVFIMLEFLSLSKTKTLLSVFLAWAACWLLAICLPFWNAATVASGLVASLGLTLFLAQKSLLSRGTSAPASYLILGLLWSVHPLWGILGLIAHGLTGNPAEKSWTRNFPPLFVGFSPQLWVLFRTNRFFPSWGGEKPFKEAFLQGKDLFQYHLNVDWSLVSALLSWGWIVPTVGLLAVFLVFFNFFKWRTGNKPLWTATDFWVWILSGIAGILGYSLSSEMLGPASVLFVFGLAEVFLKLLEKGMEKRQATFLSGSRLGGLALLGMVLTAGLVWLPGQNCLRSSFFFPQQHALNLLRTLEGRSLLVCRDSFEAEACQEARFFDPALAPTVILEEKYLSQRWYVSECITQAPELLFTNLLGTTEGILKNLVLVNRDSWNIHWALSALPPDWKEASAFPTVLTQFFIGKNKTQTQPENLQYRYDLTALPKKDDITGREEAHYFSRYVTGFEELGKALMNRGLYLASIQAFDRASRLDPSFSEPQSFLLQMYSQQKILEAAQLELEKTIKTQPRKVQELMGELDKAQKEMDEAKIIKLLDGMIQLNAELADAQYQLSVIYGRQGKTKESNALLESSLQLNPKQIEAQMTLGHLMARIGNRLKAEEAYRAVLVLNPENKEAQVELWKLLNRP